MRLRLWESYRRQTDLFWPHPRMKFLVSKLFESLKFTNAPRTTINDQALTNCSRSKLPHRPTFAQGPSNGLHVLLALQLQLLYQA